MSEKLFGSEQEYKVTARKYRPQTFEDVSSQEFITRTLKNAIIHNRISHAYLFCGPRGVGKTTCARLLAKSLNCKNRKPDGNPCNNCDSCKEISNDNRNHPDVFEIDGASNRNIEDVRELKEKVKYGPIRSKYKIFIIDEVHMLTGASFNALLKTLEEPPAYIVFIFATTSAEKVPLTILGRCQRFDFKRLTIDEIKTRIKIIAEEEKVKVDDESLFFIAKKGDGSMRDSQGLFDMASAYCENDISFEKLKEFFNLTESDVYFNITGFIKAKDSGGVYNYFAELMNKGYELQFFLDGLAEHYRNLMIARSTNSSELIMEAENVKEKYLSEKEKFSEIELMNSMKLILQTESIFKYSSNQRILIEALLLELIKFTDTKELSNLIKELRENKINLETHSSKTKDTTAEQKINYTPKKTEELKNTIEEKTETVEVISQNTNISEPEKNWFSIKEQIKVEKRWVYSMLEDTELEIDSDNNYLIKLGNYDDSRFEALNGFTDYLSGKFSSQLGQKINVVLVRDEHIIESTVKPEINPEDNYKKIKSILIDELNAKHVN